MTIHSIVIKIKEEYKCDIIKINFYKCMENNESNIEYCTKFRNDYEECIRKVKKLIF